MCLHLYQGEMARFSDKDWMECKNMQIMLSTFCEVYARKNPFRYRGIVLRKGQSFLKKSFQMWKCLKWKITQYTVIAVWFLYDVQNYADLRWPSFYSIQFASSFASYSTSFNNLCNSLKLNWVTMVNTLYSCTCTYFL